MKTPSSVPALLASALLLLGSPLLAQHAGQHPSGTAKAPPAAKTGKLVAVTEKDADWAAKARASYPLDACVVSEEKLGSMGKSPEYIYRVDGQPDRLVVFCCEGCEEDFMADPAAHLAKIDSAANSKAKPGANKKSDHKGHH